MAVVRITQTTRWLRWAAQKVEDHPRLARELRKASDRPSKMAELTSTEANILHERVPCETTARAAYEVAESLLREQARPRGFGIHRRSG